MAKKLSIVSNEKLPYSKQHTNADTFYNIKIRYPLKSYYDFFLYFKWIGKQKFSTKRIVNIWQLRVYVFYQFFTLITSYLFEKREIRVNFKRVLLLQISMFITWKYWQTHYKIWANITHKSLTNRSIFQTSINICLNYLKRYWPWPTINIFCSQMKYSTSNFYLPVLRKKFVYFYFYQIFARNENLFFK